jgi:hypothetical protein
MLHTLLRNVIQVKVNKTAAVFRHKLNLSAFYIVAKNVILKTN